jgi:hypothetical protein
MNLKTTLLAALGALFIAAPAVQAQPDDNGYYRNHHRHYSRNNHRCGFYRRGEYGVFGHYRNRLTFGCR